MKRSSKEFKSLRAEWYKKLKKTGFIDIEKSDYELYQPTNFDSDAVEQARAYYSMARRFMENCDFKSDLDATIWFLHSRGCTAREISRAVKRSNSTISRIILCYEEMMLKR